MYVVGKSTSCLIQILVWRFVPRPTAARAEVGCHLKMAAEVGCPEASRCFSIEPETQT